MKKITRYSASNPVVYFLITISNKTKVNKRWKTPYFVNNRCSKTQLIRFMTPPYTTTNKGITTIFTRFNQSITFNEDNWDQYQRYYDAGNSVSLIIENAFSLISFICHCMDNKEENRKAIESSNSVFLAITLNKFWCKWFPTECRWRPVYDIHHKISYNAMFYHWSYICLIPLEYTW